MARLKHALYEQLSPLARENRGVSPLNKVIIVAILVSVASAVLETEPTLRARFGETFALIHMSLLTLFIVEYLTRLWVIGENARFAGFGGRLVYITRWWSVIDLAAILPALLFPGAEWMILVRIFRLLRIIGLARGRFATALRAVGSALADRRFELYVSLMIALGLLLLSATALYLSEREAQPETFGSILRALWWGVATLTTVGYGDVYPITAVGKLFAAVFALAGIGLIAMPAGILASAFSDALRRDDAEQRTDADQE